MRLHPNIKLLTWFNFFTDFRPYAPIAIIYFAGVTDSYALGLAVLSIEMLATSVFELPTGVISDMVGRKRTIILGAIMSVLTLVFYSIGSSFLILAIGSIFAGLARSFYSGNNEALLHESLKEYKQENEYAEYSGKVNSMFQYALAVSALLGGIIAYYSFPLVMWLSVLPQVICLVIALKIVEPKIHEEKIDTNIYSHLKEAISKFNENIKLRTLSLASIIDRGIGETLHEFSTVFIAMLWPVWALGIARMSAHFFAAVGMQSSGKIIKRFGFFKSLLAANTYSRLAGLIAALFPTPASPIILSSSSFAFGISHIAKDALFQKEFTDKQRATMGSLNSLAGNLFFAVFAFIFGTIADNIPSNQALILGEVLLISVIFIYFRMFKHKF